MDVYEETFSAARRILAAVRPCNPVDVDDLAAGELDAGEPVGAVETALALAEEAGFALPADARRDVEWLVSTHPNDARHRDLAAVLARLPNY